jgi:N-formylglutamate amidohydrolase
MRVFRFTHPRGRELPILVSVPHAGLAVPEELRPQIVADEQVLRSDADLGVNDLFGGVSEVGASLLVAEISRLVVDLNRAEGDVDNLSVPEHRSPLPDARRGVVWRLSSSGRPILARPLSLADLEDRLSRYHEPYHQTLRKTLFELRGRHGYAILVDGHSMPGLPRGDGGANPKRRADLVPGCNGGSSCGAPVVEEAERFFRSRGYSVAVDDPYPGGFITRHYGKPEVGWHALQLEVNRDLYLDPLTLEVNPRGFARLREDLTAFVAFLGTLRMTKRHDP